MLRASRSARSTEYPPSSSKPFRKNLAYLLHDISQNHTPALVYREPVWLVVNHFNAPGTSMSSDTAGGARTISDEKTKVTGAAPGSDDPEKQIGVPPPSSGETETAPPDLDSQPGRDEAETQQTAEEERPGSVPGDVQEWCRPRGNIPRLAFAFLSFFIAGMNDAAVGVCTFHNLSKLPGVNEFS